MAKERISRNWIQKAITRPGSFTAWCNRQGFGGVTAECIAAGKKSKDPTTRRRANLAATLRGMNKG